MSLSVLYLHVYVFEGTSAWCNVCSCTSVGSQ